MSKSGQAAADSLRRSRSEGESGRNHSHDMEGRHLRG